MLVLLLQLPLLPLPFDADDVVRCGCGLWPWEQGCGTDVEPSVMSDVDESEEGYLSWVVNDCDAIIVMQIGCRSVEMLPQTGHFLDLCVWLCVRRGWVWLCSSSCRC